MCDISGGPVAVDHAHRCSSGIRELMEHARRDVNSLPGVHYGSFVAQAHLAFSFNDEVDLFLVLIVPGHLSAIWFEHHMSQREAGDLNGARAANQILSSPARGICSSSDGCKIRDDHRLKDSKVEASVHVNHLSGAVVEFTVRDRANRICDIGGFAHSALGQ
jgi:hypothetical protein